MKRLIWITLSYLGLIGSLAAFAPTNSNPSEARDSKGPIVVEAQQSQTALRPLLALMKLDLENFEHGLEASDETYWCEPMVNNGEAYVEALENDLKKGVGQTLHITAVDALSDAFATLYELCTLADAQDYIDEPKYLDAFNTVVEIREIVIEEWPAAQP